MSGSKNIPVIPSMLAWLEAQTPKLSAQQPKPLSKTPKPPPTYTDASELEALAIRWIKLARIQPFSWDRRFTSQLHEGQKLTDSQRVHLWRIAHKYRRQIRNNRVTSEALSKHRALSE